VAGGLVVGLVAAWAGGAFKVKTKDGVIVLENLPPDAEVLVDGEAVVITRDGQEVKVTAVREGPHKLRVVDRGAELLASDVTVKVGGDPVRARVDPPPARGAPNPPVPPGGDGFVSLFNGKDLTGWVRPHPKDGGVWKVQDGVVIGSGHDAPTSLATASWSIGTSTSGCGSCTRRGGSS
jgi:hypothetical protein